MKAQPRKIERPETASAKKTRVVHEPTQLDAEDIWHTLEQTSKFAEGPEVDPVAGLVNGVALGAALWALLALGAWLMFF